MKNRDSKNNNIIDNKSREIDPLNFYPSNPKDEIKII
jgi:hypothetical protein